jgi:hypothetical protein
MEAARPGRFGVQGVTLVRSETSHLAASRPGSAANELTTPSSDAEVWHVSLSMRRDAGANVGSERGLIKEVT